MGLARRLIVNSFHNAVGKVWMIVSTMVLTAYVVARLGNEVFAIWAVMLAFISYASVLELGSGNAFAKFIAEHDARGDVQALSGIVTGGVLFYLTTSSLVAVAGWLGEPYLARWLRIPEALALDFRFVLRVTLVTVAAQQAFNALRAVFFGLQRLDVLRTILIGGSLVQLAGAAVVLESGLGIRGLACAHAAYVLLAGSACWLAARRVCPGLRVDPTLLRSSELRRMVRFGAQVQLTSIAGMLHLHVDKFLLTALVGLQWTTFYELGQKAARGIATLPQMISDVVMPAASAIHTDRDDARLLRLYRESSRYIVLVTLPIVGLVLATAPSLTVLWVGPGYEWAAMALALLMLAYGVQMLTGAATAVARGVERPGLETWPRVGMAVLHVVGSLILIPRWGLPGALAASLVSGVLADAWILASIHRILRYPLHRAVGAVVWRPLLATMVAGASAYGAAFALAGRPDGRTEALQTLVVQGLAFLVVLVPALWVTRAVDVSMLRAVRSSCRPRTEAPEVEAARPAA